MILDYSAEKYQLWKELDLAILYRRLEDETAFDGIIKIYSLITNIAKVNTLLEGKFFCDFIHSSYTGVFLRMLSSKNSWPEAFLIYVDLDIPKLIEIKKTNSSWQIWKGKDLGFGKHSIEISPTEKVKYQIGSKI